MAMSTPINVATLAALLSSLSPHAVPLALLAPPVTFSARFAVLRRILRGRTLLDLSHVLVIGGNGHIGGNENDDTSRNTASQHSTTAQPSTAEPLHTADATSLPPHANAIVSRSSGPVARVRDRASVVREHASVVHDHAPSLGLCLGGLLRQVAHAGIVGSHALALVATIVDVMALCRVVETTQGTTSITSSSSALPRVGEVASDTDAAVATPDTADASLTTSVTDDAHSASHSPIPPPSIRSSSGAFLVFVLEGIVDGLATHLQFASSASSSHSKSTPASPSSSSPPSPSPPSSSPSETTSISPSSTTPSLLPPSVPSPSPSECEALLPSDFAWSDWAACMSADNIPSPNTYANRLDRFQIADCALLLAFHAAPFCPQIAARAVKVYRQCMATVPSKAAHSNLVSAASAAALITSAAMQCRAAMLPIADYLLSPTLVASAGTLSPSSTATST